MQQFVLWTLDAQRYALPFHLVERVARAVFVTPLPDVPEIVAGIINVHGRVVPVVDIRKRLELPEREILLSDLLMLVKGRRRYMAFFADTVSGVVNFSEEKISSADRISPIMGGVSGVVKLEDGMILIQDIDRFLSLDEEAILDSALSSAK